MSTTREEVLAALAAHPDGLTSKQLAPMCPACECDEMIVGRTIAALRADNLIHSGTEFRAGGGTIFMLGAPPGPATEARVPLESPRPATASTAAKAIASMRQPGATPSSAPAPQAPKESAPMKKQTVADRCIDALKKHGRLSMDALAKHAVTTKGTLYTMGAALKKLGAVKVAPGVYAMAGTAAAKATPKTERKPKKAKKVRKAPAAKAARANGRGDARFAIDESGELAIEVDGSGAVRLAAQAFARLRDFIERTKPIWDAA